MRIAFIHHSDDLTNDYAAYIAALTEETAKANGYVIKDYDHIVRARESVKEENVLLHIVLPATGKFAFSRWYRSRVNKILRRYGIKKLVSGYGITAATNVPQILLLPDISITQHEKHKMFWQQYAAKKWKNSVKEASVVVQYSHTALENVQQSARSIAYIPFTASAVFEPMEWHNKLYIKSRFAENKEYFLSILPDHDVDGFTSLLKAFTVFKKWQQSSMKLILLPKEEGFSRSVYNKLDTYKYRDDVVLVNDAELKDTADLVASAYAFVHMPANESDLWPAVVAMQCGVPVISYTNDVLKEYCATAALFTAENTFEHLGNEMIHVYKDENLKTKLAEAATERAKEFSQQAYAEKLWQLITSASL